MRQAAMRILALTLALLIIIPGLLFSNKILTKLVHITEISAQPSALIVPEEKPVVKTATRASQIPTQAIYQLLAAELAIDRNYPDIALANYTAAARETQDAKVAEHAAQIAISLGTLEDAAEPITLWAESDKNNSEAQITAAALYLRLNQVSNAITYLKRIEQLDQGTADDYFLALYKELPDKNDSANLIQALKTLAKQAQSPGAGLALEKIFKTKN